VSTLVIRRFTTLYGPPTTDDPNGFIAEYHKALQGTDAAILEAAIDAVVKRQGVPAWPPVGACVEAVNEVAERRVAERRRQEEPVKERIEPTPEQKARVKAIAAQFQAKLAANSHRLIEPSEDWSRTTKPAWDKRMATSEVARELALPRDLRRRG
jgi:hypothetical protein